MLAVGHFLSHSFYLLKKTIESVLLISCCFMKKRKVEKIEGKN